MCRISNFKSEISFLITKPVIKRHYSFRVSNKKRVDSSPSKLPLIALPVLKKSLCRFLDLSPCSSFTILPSSSVLVALSTALDLDPTLLPLPQLRLYHSTTITIDTNLSSYNSSHCGTNFL
ncbi:hypothetical protein Hanom_Chr09g00870191 [Helianthus anomalus]